MSYYTLMTSLPNLSSMEKSKELPISWIQLQKRQNMLSEQDAKLVGNIQKFLAWYYHSSNIKNEYIIEMYQKIMQQTKEYPKIQKIITEILQQRTIVAIFRLNYAGKSFNELDASWDVGVNLKEIEAFYEHNSARLLFEYPWLKEVKESFVTDNPYTLTKVLMEQIFNRAKALKEQELFCLDAFVAYLIQWAVLQKWLTFQEKEAVERFNNLIKEASHAFQ
ncbi:MAG: hypothetical protein K0U38_09195 [Epsilonproteobacteria bacterium]|nr:hypothetical protein [Campylobacterota bacterium]